MRPSHAPNIAENPQSTRPPAAKETKVIRISSDTLDDHMPEPPPQHTGRSIRFFLLQLSCHFSRHSGQLDYLRRMLS